MPAFYYSVGTFGVLEFLGEVWPGLITNGLCYPLLGCNTGFFGYDGLDHFMSGLCIGLGLLWYNRTSFKSFAMWALGIALGWECMEWVYDAVRRSVLHMNLLSPHNIMTQPTPIDTLGDIVLGCTGATCVYLWYRYKTKSHE